MESTKSKKSTSTGSSSGRAAKKKSGAKKASAKKKSGAKKASAKKKSGAKKASAKPVERKLKPLSGAQSNISSPPSAPSSSRRGQGLRGAAPWVARHAAKHAEELRKRNAVPPPPGSARSTLRTPPEAERIKAQVAQLHQLISKIAPLRKRLDKTFFEVGEVLAEIQSLELFLAKGYSSFETFLDREVGIPRATCLRILRIIHTFQREAAGDYTLEQLTAALAGLDGELVGAPPSHRSSRGFSSPALPPKPPFRFDD